MSPTKALFQQYAQQNELPLFQSFDWWQTMVDGPWEVAVVENEGQVLAFWPYLLQQKFGFQLLRQPHLTPYGGPWIHYPETQKNASRIRYENKLIGALLQQLPNFHQLEQSCALAFHNGLAMHWEGFRLENRYTYILPASNDKEQLWSGLRENIRREIKKAEKSLQITTSTDIEDLKQMVKSSFSAQQKEVPVPAAMFDRLGKFLSTQQKGQLLVAKDASEKVVATVCIVWDKQMAYYLAGGADANQKNSGAMSLLLWTALQEQALNGRKFNFEGSMIPAIERFLRGFGGDLVPYLRISANRSRILRWLTAFS